MRLWALNFKNIYFQIEKGFKKTFQPNNWK